jgi:23S rRNA (uracil1939-C5)-methyltransferase
MSEIKIEKLDNTGRGICYVNDKITFVENALPDEIVNIKLTKESKKYNEAEVVEYIKTSPKRVNPLCPFYNECGGCNLLHLSYEDTLKYKKEKIESILSKYANYKNNIDVYGSPKQVNYRNKITLKVKDGSIGYYKTKTHNITKINHCYLAQDSINRFISDVNLLNVKNGEIVIRSNYNNELLISIKSPSNVTPDIIAIKKKHKLVGIILNDKTIYGEPSFIEIINKQYFQVSYDSFFQINREVCSIIFDMILKEINDNDTILDLYCGVGTLGINACKKAKKAYGIEIVKNAILNAITNSKINKRDNIYYMLGKVEDNISKIKDNIDTIIVDPPRAGLDPKTKQTILEFKANKIIYVSCDPMTLARDLKELSSLYNIKKVTSLDMFPYTEHIETYCVLEKR